MQKQQIKKSFKGFTLVELIIVITILAILGTIAYISFQGFTKDARDSSRMSDIKQLYNGISIYKTQTEKTPMPDNYVNILSGTTTISYQGYAGTSVLRLLKITGGKDPGTKDYYIYSTDVNQKKGQLMTFMETADKDVQLLGRLKDLNIITQAKAVTNTGYYQDKKIYVYGDKIGILTDSNKVPLQETTTSTGVNIITLTTPVTTYFGGSVYSGGLSTNTGLTLVNQINGVLNNLTSNKYTVNGTITNGSGGIINACGTSTSINSSGNFTLSNVIYGTNCSSIIVTRSGYSCSITVDGPSSIINDINNISGNCTQNPPSLISGGVGAIVGGFNASFRSLTQAACFNGITNQPRNPGQACNSNNTNPDWIGKNWGTQKIIRKVILYATPDGGGYDPDSSSSTIKIDGSNDGTSWTNLWTSSGRTDNKTSGVIITIDSGNGLNVSNSFQYHRIWEQGTTSARNVMFSEIEFYE